MKATPIITNFTAGELSPLLDGRVDITRYYNGAKTLENFIPLPYGGARKRPGTYYAASVKTAAKATRVIPFQFSTTQAYILEFGDDYIRFYKDGGQIDTTVATITAATAANPVEITSVDHPFANGDEVVITTVVGMVELNGNTYTVANRTDDTFELSGINGTGYTAYTSGGIATRSGACEIATSYDTTELFDIQYAQDADTMYLVHPSHKPQTLTRSGHTNWTIADYEPTADVFTSANNYPSCVTIFERRLIFANSTTDPQKIWASKTDDYGNLTTGTNAGDGFTFVIGSEQVNAIRWLSAGSVLALGTFGGAFRASGTDGGPLIPTDVDVKRVTTYGSMGMVPQKIGNFTYFIQRNSKTVLEFIFNYDIGEYEVADMTILAEHITGTGIVDIAYQQSPYNILWCVREDGQVATLTRQRPQEVLAWSRQVLGGVFGAGDAVVESVAVIPGDEEDDEVWFVVKRTIGAATVRYIEYLKPMDFGDEQEDAYFVDCGLSADSPKTITGASIKTVLDSMEYASDGAAQTAYVSSEATSSEAIEENFEGTYGLNNRAFNGGSATEAKMAIKVVILEDITCTKVSLPARYNVLPTRDFRVRIETDASGKPSGSLMNANADKSVIPGSFGTTYAWVDFVFPSSFIIPAGTYWIVCEYDPDTRDDSRWYEIKSEVISGASGDFYYNGLTLEWVSLVSYQMHWRLYGTHTVLQCYSEDTIKQQGDYSLKLFANITDSLSDAITRTLSTTVDLTGKDSIIFNVRASRTGSNFKIGFRDSGGTTTQHTVNILIADTWQTETVDISAVTTANKDAIDRIIITILNADADNTAYIDNIYSLGSPRVTITAEEHGFSDGDYVTIRNIEGTTELNRRKFIVSDAATDTFILKDTGGVYIDGTRYTDYVSGGEARKCSTTFSGLSHLAAETVAIFVDGQNSPSKVVTSAGIITLDASTVNGAEIHAGLAYAPTVKLMRLEAGGALGTAQAKIKRIVKVFIRLYRSLGAQLGDEDTQDEIPFEADMFSGDKEVQFPGTYNRDAHIVVTQDEPAPLMILSIVPIMETFEE